MNKLYLAALACITIICSACSSQKENVVLFSDLDAQQLSGTLETHAIELKIVPDDELSITVTSLVPEATAQFNAPLTNINKSGEMRISQNQSFTTYIVDTNGDIVMPMLGKVHVAGLTITELENHIKSLVSKSVNDPYVKAQLVNFRVNVLGAVHSPGPKTTTRTRYSVLDAIADAGDITLQAHRNNVMVIRNEGDHASYHRLDLNNSSSISSPYFYLQQGDVVYVEPNNVAKANSTYNQNNAYRLSVISTIVSAASVLASLAIVLISK